MIQKSFRLTFLSCVCLITAWLLGAQVKAKPQPLMKVAHGHLKQASKHNAEGETIPTKHQLEKALKVLNIAAWDKGGHRLKAIGIIKKALTESDPTQITTLIDKAVEEVEAGIAHADERPTQNPQPLMKLAYHELKKAKLHHEQRRPLLTRERLNQALKILKKAAWDKGGHRLKAIHFTKQALGAKRPGRVGMLIVKAISEVQQGIAFSNSH